MSTAGSIPPPVSWAQRNDLVYVIIDVECKDIEHKVTENSFTFKGINALDASKKYEVTLNFLHSVDPEKVTNKNIGRCLEFTIPKKESGPFWPTLTTDKTKLHFLKANFAKWRDESDDEDAGDSKDNGMFGNFLNNQGGDWNNKFDDFNVDDDDDEEDSDDNIPSLSQTDEDDETGAEGDKQKKPAV
ncbi:prostaglandin E synthase 3 homolog [Drosophila tropicalis]|uniref:prostaglandin E synthase 3 homolog n=1 Tax=Drosophila tropicalis TaxID=46794 RepID=UPI0035ABE511